MAEALLQLLKVQLQLHAAWPWPCLQPQELCLRMSSTVRVNWERVCLGMLILSCTTICFARRAIEDTFRAGILKPSLP